ncbi:MAG: hypothetical protein KGJ09_01390 [Candidatus Omnitrophica bacterium]|nr:hypothetical protein [Candidatus Omnitrophota bacterium]MDE2008714.1 hypothetical protein [Candidatus Omnitrophota bacterium]MDE2214855.1 hypothetical protein [Candidatus Omnitrophota bacterium]MDE2231975.1 hypothetical protein [Candidatus Omnitrophota bacterium]
MEKRDAWGAIKEQWRSLSVNEQVSAMVVAAFVFGYLLWAAFTTGETHWATHPFKNDLVKYMDVPETMGAGEPYLKRKVLIIDVSSKAVDTELSSMLPDSLRATRPEEVGSVVLVYCKQTTVGYYSSRNPLAGGMYNAYRWECNVTLTDEDKGVCLGKWVFKGGPPPSETGEGGGSGSKPTWDIVTYLLSLPRLDQ